MCESSRLEFASHKDKNKNKTNKSLATIRYVTPD